MRGPHFPVPKAAALVYTQGREEAEQMEKGPNVFEMQRRLAPVFDRYGIARAVVFGSVAKGNAT